jgi:hypothetical protein
MPCGRAHHLTSTEIIKAVIITPRLLNAWSLFRPEEFSGFGVVPKYKSVRQQYFTKVTLCTHNVRRVGVEALKKAIKKVSSSPKMKWMLGTFQV